MLTVRVQKACERARHAAARQSDKADEGKKRIRLSLMAVLRHMHMGMDMNIREVRAAEEAEKEAAAEDLKHAVRDCRSSCGSRCKIMM